MALETYREQVAIQAAPTQGVVSSAYAQAEASLNVIKNFGNAAQSIAGAVQATEQLQDRREVKASTDQALEDIAQGNLSYQEGESNAILKYNELIGNASQAKLQNEIDLGVKQLQQEYANDVVGFNAAADEYISSIVEGQQGNLVVQANLKTYGTNVKRGGEVSIANREVQLKAEAAKSEILINLNNKTENVLTNARNGDLEVALNMYGNLEQETALLVEAGEMTSAKRTSIISNLQNGIIQQGVLGEFDSAMGAGLQDAENYIKQIEEEDTQDLSPDAKGTLIAKMKSDFNQELRSQQALYKAQQAANKDALELEGFKTTVATAQRSGIPLDYKNTDDKKAVNATFEAVSANFTLGDPSSQQQAIDYSISTGVVPEKVISRVRTAIYAGNPDVTREGVDLLNRMITESPQLVDQFSPSDIAFAVAVDSKVRAGLPIEQAIAQQKELLTIPAQERGKQVMAGYEAGEFTKEVTSFTDSYIDKFYDPSLFGSQPEATVALQTDAGILLKHNLTLTGDKTAAIKLTETQLNNKWGATYISGEAVMTPYPPEKVLANSNDEVSWIQEDIAKVKETIGGIGGQPVTMELTVDPSSLSGTQPRWLVMLKDENGLYRPHLDGNGNPMYWTASYKDSNEYKELQAEQAADIAQANALHNTSVSTQDLMNSGGISLNPQYLAGRKPYKISSAGEVIKE